MQRFFYVLLIVTILNSCNSAKIAGNYFDSKNSSEFKFNKDSTFQYQYGYLEYFLRSKGRWSKTNKDTIELISDIVDTKVKYNVKDSITNSKNCELLIRVRTTFPINLHNYFCRVIINKTIYTYKCDSLASIPLKLVDSDLTLQFIKNESYTTDPLVVPDLKINSQNGTIIVISVLINDNFFGYRSFNKTPIKIGFNYLEFYDSLKRVNVRIKKSKKQIKFAEFN